MMCDTGDPGGTLRIGGELELSAGMLGAGLRHAPPTFGRPTEQWTNSGRSALMLAARTFLQRGATGRVWLPAYCCRSVVQPFLAAGCQVQFYPVGDGLVSELPLGAAATGDACLFIHYFGHRQPAGAAEELRRRGVWIIEDCVQAALTSGVGVSGDFAVASYRKLLPQPDGALFAADAAPDADLGEPHEAFISQRVWGKLLRASGAEPEAFLRLIESSEGILDADPLPRRISWLSVELMARTDLTAIAAVRRENWKGLLSRLQPLISKGCLSPVFPRLCDGEVPLGMPVLVPASARDPLRRFLSEHEIFCPVHWPLDHVPDREDFAAAHALSHAMLTLPIDQRMSNAHLDRFVGTLQCFFGVNP